MKNIEKIAKEIFADVKPKKGDKFKLNWFTYKPDIEFKNISAIAFLDKGTIVEIVDDKLHSSPTTGMAYQAKIIHTPSGKVDIKTNESEELYPVSEQIIYLSLNAIIKFFKKA